MKHTLHTLCAVTGAALAGCAVALGLAGDAGAASFYLASAAALWLVVIL